METNDAQVGAVRVWLDKVLWCLVLVDEVGIENLRTATEKKVKTMKNTDVEPQENKSCYTTNTLQQAGSWQHVR